nr:uncharacterized protein LOC118059115 isoform X2 [Populus alba]
MSVFGFWALILLAGTACLSSTYSSSHDLNFPRTEDSITATTSFKEPKEGCYSQRISSEEIQKDNINMEGYSKIDPTPKSTATIVFQTNRACMALLSYLTFQDQHCWITRSKAGSNHLLRLLNHFITSQKQVLTSDMVVLKYGAISKLRLFSEVLYQVVTIISCP